MPPQKPRRSRQDYGTPDDFLDAVERRFGSLTWDLAASEANTVVADRYYSESDDATEADWSARLTERDLAWLNPPFGAIGNVWAPLVLYWTRRIPGLRVLMLVPASVGSDWFARYVHGRALVLALSPRLTFAGERDPYPKDLALCCYGFGAGGFDVWRWKAERGAAARSKREAQAGLPAAGSPDAAA